MGADPAEHLSRGDSVEESHGRVPDGSSGEAVVSSELERTFGLDELFVSTTDSKGHIRLSNAVFDRVSGFGREQLLGRAHNVVRHPDMPRSIFRVFWERLEGGDRVAAYVKNRAADGRFYWVMAVAAPVSGGYTSVHIKPSTPHWATAQEIYRELMALERTVEGDDVHRREQAIEVSSARLGELLEQAGFADYETFMYTAVAAEVDAREHGMAAHPGRDEATGEPAVTEFAPVVAHCSTVGDTLQDLACELKPYGDVGVRLSGKSKFMSELSDDIRLFSLNAMLAAARLRDGAAIGAVANILGRGSDEAGPVIRSLSGELQQTEALVRQMNFRIASSKLQVEMVSQFLREVADEPGRLAGVTDQLAGLAGTVADAVERMCSSQAALDHHLDAVAKAGIALDRHLRILQALVINGRIEASHLSGADDVVQLFVEIGQRVQTATDEMKEFAEVMRSRPDRQQRLDQEARTHAARLRDEITVIAGGNAGE